MEDRLGRGLSALLGAVNDETRNDDAEHVSYVNIDMLIPNKDQPRKEFNDEKLRELSDSIAQSGILQPITVRKKDNRYEIIAGERRWRAARMANLTTVPIYEIECDDTSILTYALIENLQRADLNAIEEAEALKSLLEKCNCTQDEAAKMISKSRSYVTNSLRLLTLPESVRNLIASGTLTAGHGKALLGSTDPALYSELTMRNNWNVRQLEHAVRETSKTQRNITMDTPFVSVVTPETVEIAQRIQELLHVETRLKVTKAGGVISLICHSCDELETLVNRLMTLDNEQ